jgi:hypothetical protein
MILLLLAAMAASSPVPPPASCGAERAAIADEMATINAHYTVPRPQFGPLGTRYVQISEQLTALMRADEPDLVKIEKLWRETDRLRLQLRANSINADTQCKLDELKLMPVEARKKFLRLMAPMTQDEIGRIPVVPPVTPPPPRP